MFSGKSEDMLRFTDSNLTSALKSSGIRKSMAPLTVCTFSLPFQFASPDSGVDGSVYPQPSAHKVVEALGSGHPRQFQQTPCAVSG
jgi:hypothetical protein